MNCGFEREKSTQGLLLMNANFNSRRGMMSASRLLRWGLMVLPAALMLGSPGAAKLESSPGSTRSCKT